MADRGWLQMAMRVRDLEVRLASSEDPRSRLVRSYRAAVEELFGACRDVLGGLNPAAEERPVGHEPEGWRTGA